jgi:DNA-binding NarL/FixJ family response regulator
MMVTRVQGRDFSEEVLSMSVKVVIADDHEVVRRGLVSLLAGSEVKIVGEAANGDEALKLVRKLKPDVVLLDIRMPGKDGLTTLEKIRADLPQLRVVMLSTFDNPTYVARAVAAGAHDYILKGASRAEIIAAITGAAAGQLPARAGELRRVATTMANRVATPDPDIPLTQRETQVLRHMALGLSNKEIAQSLTISVETVKEHVQNILRKIAVTDRTQAAVWAVRRGLV